MARAVILLAKGFEEVEAVAVIDVLRRAQIEVTLAGLNEGFVESARGVKIIPDTTIDTIKSEDYDIVILPGGMPGTDNLNADSRVKKLLLEFASKGRLTGAICAAPYVLANAGLLEGKKATSYPTYKDKIGNVDYKEDKVVVDGNVLTSRGPATALCFGFAIVERLVGKEKSEEIKKAMLVDYCD
ncbi:MAG: DJ-1/PfpI family protein [Thermodesulfovibrionales bacterium]|nr:DJ-1/PfpI family protein [Thermodesulfovibrionales bacterium]